MFFAMDNSLLVRGSLEYFRVLGDNNENNYGWVERDGYVYDPTWISRFDKKYYYKIFNVKDVHKYTQEEYCNCSKHNNDVFKKVKSTTIDSIKNNGFDRLMFSVTIPLLQGIAEQDENFKRDLYKYLEEINYNALEIKKSINEKIRMI